MFDLQLFGGHTPDLPICRAKKRRRLTRLQPWFTICNAKGFYEKQCGYC
jgi:hypothetical protein